MILSHQPRNDAIDVCLNLIIDPTRHIPLELSRPSQSVALFIAEEEAQQEAHNNPQVHPRLSAVALETDRSWHRWEVLRTRAVVRDRRLAEEACSAWDIRLVEDHSSYLVERSSMCSAAGRRIGDRLGPSCSY